jgi:hypothetical protein
LHHVGEFERALLLGHAGMKDDLQEQVSELVAQILQIAARNRVGHLEGFLDGVGCDGREVLFKVPWAPGLRGAQRLHDLDQAGNIARRFHAATISNANGCRDRSGGSRG